MHREEYEGRGACSDCGAEISASANRGFSFGTQGILCWECAIRRGGTYDADQDRWTEAPDVADLPEKRSET